MKRVVCITTILWRSVGGPRLWVSYISAPSNLRLNRMPYLCAIISYRFFHGWGFQSWLLNVISARCGKGSVQTFNQRPRAPLTTPFLTPKVSNVTEQPLLSCPRPLDSPNRTIGRQWRLVIRLYNSPIRGVAQAHGTVRPIQIKTTCYPHIASFSCLG